MSQAVTRPGPAPLGEDVTKRARTSGISRNDASYVNPQSEPGKFNLAHLSGNWNRVACDFQRLFLEKYPSARILDLHDSSVPTYTVDMDAALQAMIHMGKIAKAAGCEVAAIACNTMHLHKARFETETGLQMLHMIQAVKDRIMADFSQGSIRIGVVGSLQTMSSDLYAFDEINKQIADGSTSYEVLFPNDAQRQVLNRLIIDHKKMVNPYMCESFLSLLKTFAEERKLDCIVLGCTDFASLLQERIDDKFSFSDLGSLPGVVNKNHLLIDSDSSSRTVVLYDSVECLVEVCAKHVCRHENMPS